MANQTNWTLLSKHAIVLLALSRAPESTMGQLSEAVGLSTRWTIKVVQDLVDAGYVHRERVGRSYAYRVETGMPLRHALVRHHDVATLTRLLEIGDGSDPDRSSAAVELRDLQRRIAEEQQRLADLRAERAHLETTLDQARAVLRTARPPRARR